MYFLNSLKEFSIYNKKVIMGIDNTVKNMDLKKNNMIYYASFDVPSIDFINLGIFSSSYFKSYYVPKRFNTIKKNKLMTNNIKKIYKEVLTSCNQIRRTKINIKDYGKYNLFYDLSYELNANINEYKMTGLRQMNFVLNFLADKVNENTGYKQKCIVIPVGKNDVGLVDSVEKNPNGEINISGKSLFYFIYRSVIRRTFPEKLRNVRFVFVTETGVITTFKYDEDKKKNKCIQSMNKIKNIVLNNAKVLVEDEISDSESNLPPVTRNSIKNSKIVDRVMKDITSKIHVDVEKVKNPNIKNLIDDLEEKVTDKVNSLPDQTLNDYEKLMQEIENDEYLVLDLNVISDADNNGLSTEKEIARLKKQQEEKVTSLTETIAQVEALKLDKDVVENENILNDEPKHNSIKDFDRSYVQKQMKQDLVNILKAFNNDPDVKLFVKNVQMENTSDYFNKKVTYRITFVDDRKNVHNVTIDYPILKDDKFMLIGGGKKLLQKQLLLYPIVKTKPNEVQITTSYNKMIVRRFGNKLNAGTENLSKLFIGGDLNNNILRGKKFKYTLGNNIKINKDYITSLEYSQLCGKLNKIETGDLVILFSQKDLDGMIFDTTSNLYDQKLSKLVNDKTKCFDKDVYFPIGYTSDKKNIIIGNKSNSTAISYFDGEKIIPKFVSLTEFFNEAILEANIDSKLVEEYYSYKAPNTMMYNRIKINNKHIPIIIVLSYEKGITDIINRYGIEYEFKKVSRITKQYGKKFIKFSDGYLIYNSMDLKSTLLLDGLNLMDTENYEFEEFNTKEPYLEFFLDAFGSRNIGKGIHNTLTLMLQDPITLDCLKMLKLPENIYDLLLYANTLLTDNTYNPGNDMHNYRLRGAEQINSKLYKLLANAFRSYKDTLGNANPVKISIPRDALIKEIIGEKTVDEYSILNPSLEVDKISAVTFKGPSGINLD